MEPLFVLEELSGQIMLLTAPCSQIARSRKIAGTIVSKGKIQQRRKNKASSFMKESVPTVIYTRIVRVKSKLRLSRSEPPVRFESKGKVADIRQK